MKATAVADLHAGGRRVFFDIAAERLLADRQIGGGALREGADGQAVVCPLLRGSSPTRGVAPKQHRVPRVNLFSHLTRARGR
jgi:hypothetical protein